MIKRALVLLSICSLPLLCKGAGLVNGTLSPINNTSRSSLSVSNIVPPFAVTNSFGAGFTVDNNGAINLTQSQTKTPGGSVVVPYGANMTFTRGANTESLFVGVNKSIAHITVTGCTNSNVNGSYSFSYSTNPPGLGTAWAFTNANHLYEFWFGSQGGVTADESAITTNQAVLDPDLGYGDGLALPELFSAHDVDNGDNNSTFWHPTDPLTFEALAYINTNMVSHVDTNYAFLDMTALPVAISVNASPWSFVPTNIVNNVTYSNGIGRIWVCGSSILLPTTLNSAGLKLVVDNIGGSPFVVTTNRIVWLIGQNNAGLTDTNTYSFSVPVSPNSKFYFTNDTVGLAYPTNVQIIQ